MRLILSIIVSVVCLMTAAKEPLRASLVVASPTASPVQSTYGHMFLRMESPSDTLDLCYTLETGGVEGAWSILTANYKTRIMAFQTSEYEGKFIEAGRNVTEYALNLTQEEITSLWMHMDQRVALGFYPYNDFINHGCASEIVRVVLDEVQGGVCFKGEAYDLGMTRFAVGTQRLQPQESWGMTLTVLALTLDAYRGASPQSLCYLPTAVPYILQHGYRLSDNGNGKPLLEMKDIPEYQSDGTPVYLYLTLILVLTVLVRLVALRWRWLEVATNLVYALFYLMITAGLIIVNISTTIPQLSGMNPYFLFFNPVPLLFWLWALWKKPSYRVWQCAQICGVAWGTAFVVLQAATRMYFFETILITSIFILTLLLTKFKKV